MFFYSKVTIQGVKEVSDGIWLVRFVSYDLGFFDDETCRLESAHNPFEPKVSPMSSADLETMYPGRTNEKVVAGGGFVRFRTASLRPAA